jgi:hypothetical protein
MSNKKMTNDDVDQLISRLIVTVSGKIESTLIERLKKKGFEPNEETVKRVTRLYENSLTVRTEKYYLDYDTDQQQFLFSVEVDMIKSNMQFSFVDFKPIGGIPITVDELIIKKPST